jgi:pimeloyl-ACP methyl ester carboxylesterase
MNANYRDYEWRSREGLALYARDYGAANAKLPVVCIPGLTRNSRDFEDAAPWIAQQGRRVLAVDLRGRGRSERDPDRRRYNPRTYADDMAALLRLIGAPKAVFIGTSLGGLVAMTIGARHAGLIGAAVLNDVAPQVAKAGFARIQSYVGKSPPVETWQDAAAYARRTNGLAFPDYTDDAWPPFARRMFKEENGRPVLDYDPHIFRPAPALLVRLAQPLIWAAFKRLSKGGPLLLIHGELTDIIDAPTLRRMKRAAPHMSVAKVPRVGHAPMLTEPEARTALAAFLKVAP